MRIARSGIVQILIGTSSWVGLVRVLAGFGSAALAGYTIAIRVVLFALLPSWGMANAAATLVGQNLGAGRPDRAEQAVWRAAFYNFLFLGSVGLIFVLLGGPIVGLFTSDPVVAGYGSSCLRIVAAGFLFYAYGMVVTQALTARATPARPPSSTCSASGCGRSRWRSSCRAGWAWGPRASSSPSRWPSPPWRWSAWCCSAGAGGRRSRCERGRSASWGNVPAGSSMPDVPATHFRLRCAECARIEAPGARGLRCPGCDGSWLIEYDLPPAGPSRDGRGIPQIPALPGVFRYLPLLPLRDPAAIVSLGEGGTPLLRAARLGARLGIEALYLKDEARNPTGSFKDRMLAVGIARARELGHHTVAVQSSGNVGASAAAYAAAAGLSAKIFVPRTVPQGKLVQIAMYGADLVRVDHASPAVIFELLLWASQELGWYIVSTTARYNPFVLEGAKTIVYELAEQTGFALPDWLIAPVGGAAISGCSGAR